MVGGIDLVIRDQNNNPVSFDTGDAKLSKEFWIKMKLMAARNLEVLEFPQLLENKPIKYEIHSI